MPDRKIPEDTIMSITEEIDCFEDYDPQRCIDCEQKNDCLFYEPPKEK